MRAPLVILGLTCFTGMFLASAFASATSAPADDQPTAPAPHASASDSPFAPHAPADDPPPPAPDGLALTDRYGGHVGGVTAAGKQALASFGFRVHEYDVSDPSAPKVTRSGPTAGGRPALLPGNLAKMVQRGGWTYGLMDWDRQEPSGEATRLRLVVLDAGLNVAGTLDLPGVTLAGPGGSRWGAGTRGLEIALLGEHHILVAVTEPDGYHVRSIDVSRPAAPALVGDYRAAGIPLSLAVSGDFAYVLERNWESRTRTLADVDFSTPSAPTISAPVSLLDRAEALAFGDGHVFVAGCDGIEVFSLADPRAPLRVGAVDLRSTPPPPGPGPTPTPSPPDGAGGGCEWVAQPQWRDGLLYFVANESLGFFSFQARTVLTVFDVRRPEAPLMVGKTQFLGGSDEMAIGDGFGIVASMFGGMGVVSVARPDLPQSRGPLVGGRSLITAVGAGPDFVVQNAAHAVTSELQFIVRGRGIVGTFDLGEEDLASAIVVQDGWVYAITERTEDRGAETHFVSELRIIDARDPAAPRATAMIPGNSAIAAIAVDGDRLWLAERDFEILSRATLGSLRVFDIREPGRPIELGRVAGDFVSIAVAGGRVYAGVGPEGVVQGFRLVEAAGGAVVEPIGERVALDSPPLTLVASGSRLYARDEENRLHVIDVGDPDRPRVRGMTQLAGRNQAFINPFNLAVRGNVVYAGNFVGVETIDASDPAAPRSVAVRPIPDVFQIVGPIEDRFPSGGQVAVSGWDVYFAGDMTGLWKFGAGTPPRTTEVIEGLYWANFEHSRFGPGATCPREGDEWYLHLELGSDFESRYRALYPEYRNSGPQGKSGWAWARFEGRVSPPSPGRFIDRLDRAVTVTRVVDMWALPSCAFAPRPVATPTAWAWLPWVGGGP